ncbi:MAG: type III-A CRISPR-associated protein Csm2 [Methanothrix sp.]|nr:type III-A CRISPR-associated protein Csm2 [Methanothrix sp.]MCX8207802.1 type III-A CRISPR-associated protein Csm2 [Methanothrix sp.]
MSRSPRENEMDQIKGRIGGLASFKNYSGDKLVTDAEKIADSIRNLKTAQLRRIYGEVKRMEMDFEKSGEFSRDRVVLLKPRLAYAASKKSDVRPLAEIFSKCIDKIGDRDDFRRFVNFFEAILAYHKG